MMNQKKAIRNLVQRKRISSLSPEQKAFASKKGIILDPACPLVVIDGADEEMMTSIAELTAQKIIRLIHG
jgi:hypothetical protein